MGERLTGPAALLADLRSMRLELKSDGERVYWRPGFKVTEPLRRRIVAHKAGLIALLSDPGLVLPRCEDCGRSLDSRRRCASRECWDRLCEVCGRRTGSYFIGRCFICGNAGNGQKREGGT